MSDLEATSSDSGKASRRTFIKTASAAAVAAGAVGPTILGAADKAGVRSAVIGTGEHTYECLHNWGELPAHVQWGETHGVAVDEAGFIYIKHRNRAETPQAGHSKQDQVGSNSISHRTRAHTSFSPGSRWQC